MTALRLNRMHYPVTSLGYGTRAGIWLQGCTIGCHGCVSRDTWDPAGGQDTDPMAVVRWLDSLPSSIDGLVVSGGEPLQQPAALGELLAAVHQWRGDNEFDLLVFSGYRWPHVSKQDDLMRALTYADAVVAGPYVERRNTGVPLRGSDNQEIITLTPLGQRRYGDPSALKTQGMQVCVDSDTIRLIGIPKRGDLDRIHAGLTARGLTLEAVTWQG